LGLVKEGFLMKTKAICRGLLLAMLLPPVAAAGSITVRGSVSCGKFVKDPDARQVSVIWALGFITATNYIQEQKVPKHEKDFDVLNGADADAIELWLVNFCTKEPLIPFWFAVGELVGLTPK
jgi:hypothetical protein